MNLKEIRKSQGLLQSEVALALNINLSTYAYYERGDRKLTPEMLCRLADFFDVTVDELLGRTTEPQLFDDARVERPEILELYDKLTPAQQKNLLNYARGMAVANELTEDTKQNNKQFKHA